MRFCIQVYSLCKKVVYVENETWRLHAMNAWLQSLDIHSSSLGSGNFWSSVVLRSNDLIAVEPEYFGFDAYNPKLVARQFGLVQMLATPYLLIDNDPWMSRAHLKKEKPFEVKLLALLSCPTLLGDGSLKLFEASINGGIMYS